MTNHLREIKLDNQLDKIHDKKMKLPDCSKKNRRDQSISLGRKMQRQPAAIL